MADWFPHEVEGWLSEVEGRALAALAAGKTVLEIGSYCGRSTVCLAQAAKMVYAVDTFDGRSTPEPASTYLRFEDAIAGHGVVDRVTVCPGKSVDVVPRIPAEFDVVFVDGAHDYESVRDDVMAAWPKLKPDGVFAFHDYRIYPHEFPGWDAGVTRAVDQLVSKGGEIVSRHGTLAVVKPPTTPV